MNEHVEKRTANKAGKNIMQPAECVINSLEIYPHQLNCNKSNLSELESPGKINEVTKEQIKGLLAESALVSNLIVKTDEHERISGYGLVTRPVENKFIKIGDQTFIVKSEKDSLKSENSFAKSEKGCVKFNFDFIPVELPEESALLGYYNDGTGHLYNVAKLIELTKDLVPFDAPIQAMDLSAEIWKNCNIIDLAYHVKLVNEADLNFPIILDWNGGIADGRHRLIKAMTLGHSTIKCVRMTYKPNFDKVLD